MIAKLRLSPKNAKLWTPWLLLAPTFAIMLYAFVIPMLSFLRFSTHTFSGGRLTDDFSLKAYKLFMTDPYYHLVIYDTLRISLIVTLLSIAIGYPLAFVLWRLRRPSLQRWLGLIIFSPILVSVVVRSYGWTVLLADQGPINTILLSLGIIGEPLRLVFNQMAVLISMTHVFLPFVVFPIYASMTRLDPALKEAAQDLGAGWWYSFRRVTLPLTLPGLVAGGQICFTLALGAFVTPAILGGGRVLVLPLQVYRATSDINWPIASVGGLVLLLFALIVVVLSNKLLKFAEV